jgi:protein-disulfide isomerase
MRKYQPFGYRSSIAITAALAATLALTSVVMAAPSSANASAAAQANAVVATIGNEKVVGADVVAQAKDAFRQQQDEYDLELRELQLGFAQSEHDLLQQQLDKLLDRRALEKEAKARGVSTNAVLQDVKVTAVTDAEIRSFYDANKARTTATYEQLAPQIEQYLASQHNDGAMRTFYDGLRAKYRIRSQLKPYRVAVAPFGPSRGRTDAPITIVEFGDFQCPYCKEAESTLQAILATYPNEVRLVFRELPLTQLHPNAMVSAEAGVCADRQGKFWTMHDAMYNDQNSLDADGLKETAKRIGLDVDAFAACVSDAATTGRIAADVKAAHSLGIGATPYFFVNGRPINGSVPFQKFSSVVDDELHELGSSASPAVSPQG